MNVLGMFVKQPVEGQVKTRLAREIGSEAATRLYAAFVEDLIVRFRTVGARRILYYAPDHSASIAAFQQILDKCGCEKDYELRPQPSGSLGERLQHFFDGCFQEGAERTVVIGSDSPTLPARLIDEAFAALRHFDCVTGPATDGGYYLLGQRKRHSQRSGKNGHSLPLFGGIEWSSPRVLAQTVQQIARHEASLSVLPPWYDVDTMADLWLLAGHLQALRVANPAGELSCTERILRAGIPEAGDLPYNAC